MDSRHDPTAGGGGLPPGAGGLPPGGKGLPPEAWATALAGLPQMGPARLTALLRRWRPAEAWARVCAGTAVVPMGVDGCADPALALGAVGTELLARWRQVAAGVDVEQLWARHGELGVGAALAGGPSYPVALVGDPEAPAVLFHLGDPDGLDGPRVAIVGTRRCTRYGVDVAHELGRDLAAAGVRVVSGLALGIDGAAHAGALDARAAPPAAVVGSGLDVVYPRRHAGLWRAVAERGVVLSEAPLGSRPERWRFPARNRIIAGLADVVVVVESHASGGSLHTVAEAAARDRPVLAVPGPVRSPASAGTNALLADGAQPGRDATDVLVALGLSSGLRRSEADPRPPPEPADRRVLDALGWQPATLDHLAGRTGTGLADLALALARLAAAGWVAERGGWYERVARGEP